MLSSLERSANKPNKADSTSKSNEKHTGNKQHKRQKKSKFHDVVQELKSIRQDAKDKVSPQSLAMKEFDKLAKKDSSLTSKVTMKLKRKFTDAAEAEYFLGLNDTEKTEWLQVEKEEVTID